ncbi:hypothetical protein ACH4YO_07985 [Streptomyces noursei]|uniref:hypothetical protein n=1 Tax=Streptomyces noursei TaxID=1971 RepID=UPI003404524B
MSTERVAEFKRLCEAQREHLVHCEECDSVRGRHCQVVRDQLDAFAGLIMAFTDAEYREAFGKGRRQ